MRCCKLAGNQTEHANAKHKTGSKNFSVIAPLMERSSLSRRIAPEAINNQSDIFSITSFAGSRTSAGEMENDAPNEKPTSMLYNKEIASFNPLAMTKAPAA